MQNSTLAIARNHAGAPPPPSAWSAGWRRLRRWLLARLPPALQDLKLTRYYLKYGEPELRLLPLLCHPLRDAIDIGANEGMYTHLMRRHARHVYAFEALPALAERLDARRYCRVTVRCCALSDRPGTGTLYTPLYGETAVHGLSSLQADMPQLHPACASQPVRMVRLDDVYAGNVGCIKIDVEGHELSVLRGAQATIARTRPNLVIEAEENLAPGVLGAIDTMLRPLGYAGYYLHRGALRELSGFDAAVLQDPRRIEGFRPGLRRADFPDFVSNFIFIAAADLRLQRALARLARRG
jgi:FkbM family methyltransferase